MLYAITSDGKKVIASPDLKERKVKVYCPVCDPFQKNPLKCRCGEDRIPHFAHPPGTVCDAYRGKETDWHKNWKKEVHSDYCEVVINKNNKQFVADIKNKNNLVIELQHSPIDPKAREDREVFYDNMVWLFDATNLKPEERVKKPKERIIKIALDIEYNTELDVVFCNYKWNRSRKWILDTKKPLFLDLGYNLIFYIPNHSSKEGYGCAISKDTFIEKVLEGNGLRKFSQSKSGLEIWKNQIKSDKKKERKTIEEFIDCCCELIIEKDVGEQIFFNTLQEEIRFCNESYENEIIEQEIMFFNALKEEIEFCNEVYQKEIIVQEMKFDLDLEYKEKLFKLNQNNCDLNTIDRLIDEYLEKKKNHIQYLKDLRLYNPEIVPPAIVEICDFIANNKISIKDKYIICQKMKYKSSNFRLHIFEYLENKEIISYSEQKSYWYLSNTEFIKELKESALFYVLKQKLLLEN